ncbi:hypothetical protein WAE58_21795 [Pedobacter panaciterrae]|uniref:Uncharacterized protein n=1 Tax=Pedobacter panaciterrae TaxID=363849 RepID=A0ABU8NT27_9SPHI
MEENIQEVPENFIFKTISDTLTGKKIHQITVKIRMPEKPKPIKYSLWDWIMRKPRPIQPEPELFRTFEIWPCITRNQYRIAGNAALLIDGLSDIHSDNIKFIEENQPIIAYIVAAAIQNNKYEPEPELIQFIEENFDGDDLYTALRASFDNFCMQAFSNSIVLLKGTVAILKPETNPKDGSELIASHTETSGQYASILDGRQIQ